MPNTRIQDWPFKKDEAATVIRITSPIRTRDITNLFITVTFESNTNGEMKDINVPWGLISEFWMGRKYINGLPDKSSKHKNSKQLKLTDPRNYDLIEYKGESDSKYLIEGERYVFFNYNQTRYCVSCIEITRAFYARNSTFANQLFSTAGFEDLIVKNSVTYFKIDQDPMLQSIAFDLNCQSYKFAKPKDSATIIALIHGTQTLRLGFDSVKRNHLSKGKIIVKLPRITDGILEISNLVPIDNFYLIGHLDHILPCPYSGVFYGPEQEINMGNISSKIYARKKPGEIEITGPEIDTTTSTQTSDDTEESITLLNRPIIQRKKATTTNNRERIRTITVEVPQIAASTSPSSLGGEVEHLETNTPVKIGNVETGNETKTVTECKNIKLLISALNHLQEDGKISFVSLKYKSLAEIKETLFTSSETSGFSRNCALAEVTFKDTHFLIVEVDLSDDHSLATAIFRTPETETDKFSQEVLELLISAGGHWVSETFNRFKFQKLNHRVDRNAKVLAFNIINKLNMLA